MKNKKYIIIILLLILVLVGCKNTKGNEDENLLPEDTIAFLEAVEKIEFSLNCKEQLEVCFELYDNLGENSWDYDEVLDAFNMLVKFENLIKNYEAANHFISLVDDIPYVVTLEDKVKIEAAVLAYELLNDAAKEFLDVELAYNNLMIQKEAYETLEKADNEIKDAKFLAEFIVLVRDIPSLNIFTLQDITFVEKAEEYYLTMSDSSKLLEDTIVAYKVVTDARAHYEKLINEPSILEGILIEKFITLVSNLPSVEKVTLESITEIESAEAAYRELSLTSREEESVVSANNKLGNLRNKYNELLAAKEEQEKEEEKYRQLDKFLNLVYALPIINELKATDGPKLAEARAAYESLSEELKAVEEVEWAIGYLEKLENEFTKFTLNKITFSFYNLISSGGIAPNVVLQGIELTFYNTLKQLYGVSTGAELGKCVDFYFYIYHSNETNSSNYICYGDIENVLISESNVVSYGTVISLLQEASKYDPELVSGNFKFGVQVVDRMNMYEDSDIFVGTGVINYSFENLYESGTEEPKDYIEISTKEEFLAIKNNLSGNYVLINDIDLEGMEWENLGQFKGTLDGRGHKIMNMAHANGGDAIFGIFLEVLSGAKVSRIILEGTVSDAGAWAGAICVRNYGTIENCIINLDITAEGEAGHIGGISTDNNGVIKNCLVLSKINGKGTLWGSCTANLVINNNGIIQNCYASKDNSLTEKTIHANNGSSVSCGTYTNNELKNSTLYSMWDTTIWNIITGEIPSLIIE